MTQVRAGWHAAVWVWGLEGAVRHGACNMEVSENMCCGRQCTTRRLSSSVTMALYRETVLVAIAASAFGCHASLCVPL